MLGAPAEKGWAVMAPRLSTLCRQIVEMGFDAELAPWTSNTDRKCGRLRIPGKGRKGKRLVVRDPITGKELLDHRSGDTYRVFRFRGLWEMGGKPFPGQRAGMEIEDAILAAEQAMGDTTLEG